LDYVYSVITIAFSLVIGTLLDVALIQKAVGQEGGSSDGGSDNDPVGSNSGN
jgi:hypothetical protein